ncbi:NAD(P)-dependent oxidoreductase [Xanthobacter sp. DSM 24535]|uniref:NAD-dependent epimerase/dehydratase family protein n=1 Tax=Roseixanthobacter psychrophilus TaxID=3119917 RepID=UPI003729E3A5
MKLLITGAGGFVGAAVARAAVEGGHHVVGTVRPGGSRQRLSPIRAQMRVFELDLRDSDGVSAMMREEPPDVVIHLAWNGVSNRARFDRLQITDNIDASCGILDAAVQAGAGRFVGLGSQGEYGALSGKISESDLPEPSSLYGAAKLAVLHLTRQLAAQAGVTFTWLRLFSTYGPGDKPDWLIPSMIEEMMDGSRPRTTLGTQRWDYLFIDDVARGILAAAIEPGVNGIYNLGSGQPVPVRQIVESIRDLVAPEMELVFGEIPYRADQIWHMEADIARLTKATGWTPRIELEAGLAKTVAWHRECRDRGLSGGKLDRDPAAADA